MHIRDALIEAKKITPELDEKSFLLGLIFSHGLMEQVFGRIYITEAFIKQIKEVIKEKGFQDLYD